jgi:hypothetical protein
MEPEAGLPRVGGRRTAGKARPGKVRNVYRCVSLVRLVATANVLHVEKAVI